MAKKKQCKKNKPSPVYTIIQEGDERLRKPCVDVDISDHKKLTNMAFKMIRTMNKAGGVGLAMPQVGVNINMFVATMNGVVECVINPTIEDYHGAETQEEGCLSVEGKHFVTRNKIVVVSYYSLHLRKYIEKELHGMDARVFQHEYDHLQGRLISD